MASNISIEELAVNIKNLNRSERDRLKELIGEEWFENVQEEELEMLRQLLKKSKEQIKRGEFVPHENVINEVQKKVWDVKIIWSRKDFYDG